MCVGPNLARYFVSGEFYPGFWVYWVGPLSGALVAAAFFRYLLALGLFLYCFP